MTGLNEKRWKIDSDKERRHYLEIIIEKLNQSLDITIYKYKANAGNSKVNTQTKKWIKFKTNYKIKTHDKNSKIFNPNPKLKNRFMYPD